MAQSSHDGTPSGGDQIGQIADEMFWELDETPRDVPVADQPHVDLGLQTGPELQ